MCIDPVLIAFVSYRTTKVDWPSSGVSDDILSNYFATLSMQDFLTVGIVPVKRQNIDGGLLIPELTAFVDVIWFRSIA